MQEAIGERCTVNPVLSDFPYALEPLNWDESPEDDYFYNLAAERCILEYKVTGATPKHACRLTNGHGVFYGVADSNGEAILRCLKP